jgi:hypothetical protein
MKLRGPILNSNYPKIQSSFSLIWNVQTPEMLNEDIEQLRFFFHKQTNFNF